MDILIDKLSIRYGQRWLYENFSLRLAAGQWHSFLGASGVGKTTLLRAIAGLIPVEDGQISLASGCDRQGQMAYLAQQVQLLPWLSALDNVLLGWHLRGEKIDKSTREQAQHFLQAVKLLDVASSLPDALSGGMRQRVAIARTLMEDKPIVLMDEPFSAVDALTRYSLYELALDLLQDKTIIQVTHDPHEALRVADKIYVLRDFPVKVVAGIDAAKTVDPSQQEQQVLKLLGVGESQ